MSVLLMSAVFEMDLAPVPKLVLLALADFANDEGICWPSQERIATKASTTTRTVREHFHDFIDKGWVQVIQKGRGPGTTSIYRLLIPEAPSDKDRKPLPLLPTKTGSSRTTPEAPSGQDRKLVHKDPSVEPSTDPSTAAAARAREQEFSKLFGRKPTRAEADDFTNYQSVHPPGCMAWALKEISGGTKRPVFRTLRLILDDCEDMGHGPRQRRFERQNGRGKNRGVTQARLDGFDAAGDPEKPLTAAERGGRW